MAIDVALLAEICEVAGAPGYEKRIRDIVLREVTPLVDEVRVDNLGNVTAIKKGKEDKKVMIGAHMDPEGGVKIGHDLGCKRMVPMHWGTFVLSTEPFDEPRTRFKQAAGNQSLVMRIGETIGFSDVTGLDK